MMVREVEGLETHLAGVQLNHRALWLDAEDRLGLIAETLAEVLGWQPTESQLLPDALELVDAAAARIVALESATADCRLLTVGRKRRCQQSAVSSHLHMMTN